MSSDNIPSFPTRYDRGSLPLNSIDNRYSGKRKSQPLYAGETVSRKSFYSKNSEFDTPIPASILELKTGQEMIQAIIRSFYSSLM